MAQRFFNPAPQFFYSGTPAAPLSGGSMFFYEPGTNTPKDTYSDNGLTTPDPNPVVLSSSGVLPNVFLSGTYRVNLCAKYLPDGVTPGAQQPGWPKDSVNSMMDIAYSEWEATIVYGEGRTNIVYASNGQYYISIQANNLGNEPSISPLWWELLIDYLLAGQTTIGGNELAVGTAPDGLAGLAGGASGTYLESLGAGIGFQWSVLPDVIRDLQSFTSSGTWTKPTDASFVFVEIWGGGGGGGANTGPSQIGGGAGGEYVSGLFLASALGATESVTVGAGGAGGAAGGPNPGSAGGNTSFGAFLTAIGGNPGTTGAAYATVPRSRAATASTAGAGAGFAAIVFPQAGYGGSSSLGGNTLCGGAGGGGNAFAGGTSAYGGAGGAGTDTLNTAGDAGTAPGGGGGGSGDSAASGGGGAGARGEARIWSW